METIAIVSRKGGTGKTATVQALGAGLRRRGYSVLHIDLDNQANLTFGMGADPERIGIMEVLTQAAKAREVIQHTPNGDVIAGSESLAGIETVVEGPRMEYRLAEALKGLKYDFCILDTPASLGLITANALIAATNVIVTVQADLFSIQGLSLLQKAIASIEEYDKHKVKISGILITRYSGRAIISRDMRSNLQEVADILGTRLYNTPIRECVAIREAQATRTDIFSFAPKSNGAKDYAAFIEEYIKSR